MNARLLTWAACVLMATVAHAQPAPPPQAAERNSRGSELLKRGQAAEAITELQAAVEMAPEYVTARVNLAYAFEQAGQLSQAIEAYERVLGQDPGHTTARNNLANLYSRSGRHDDAIRELEAILQQKPDDTTARRNLDIATRNKTILGERHQQSARALAAAESRPSDPRAAYDVARVFAQQGDHDKALAWLDKALRLGYDQVEFLRVDPALTALRNDARFGQLLEQRAAK